MTVYDERTVAQEMGNRAATLPQLAYCWYPSKVMLQQTSMCCTSQPCPECIVSNVLDGNDLLQWRARHYPLERASKNMLEQKRAGAL
jgi:hypothetical protein